MNYAMRIAVLWILLSLVGCSTAPAVVEITPTPESIQTQSPTETFTPQPSPTVTATITVTPQPTADTRLDPYNWAQWPVVPTISARALEIYTQGIANGNDPLRYSVVGDCQSMPNVFLGIYGSTRYILPEEYAYLQQTIDYFGVEAFTHESVSTVDGLSAPSALSALWADQTQCQPDENPVACELRLYHPSIVFINLGTNWQAGASAERYGEYLRQIVDIVIQTGALPVLSTKADNVEGDHSINRVTAEVAYEYDIPLFNFWLAADYLPNHGLDPDRENVYLIPDAWDERSFTALRTLDAILRAAGAIQ